MPYGSYQQNNDYSLVKDIRPFDMPYQALMQEISTKDEYFKVGVDRIKSAYEQAVGLDPQYTQGKEYLKDFVSKASTNLEKISKSDISIMDNSQQAINVFKPLFDTTNPFNRKLIMDSQLNQFYKKQQSISDNYRTRDGGKQWNINNDIYFKDAQNKYLQDAQNGDYSTIDSNYQNKKAFTPYYDYKKEITDIQDACKGASTETQEVGSDPGYFVNKSSKGCDPEQLAYAFQTGLSDSAKQQMAIDGYAHYRGQEDVLAKHFTDKLITRPKLELDGLKATVAGLQAGTQDNKTKAYIDTLNNRIALKQKLYDANLSDFNDMTKGNPLQYVKNNFDKLAGNVWTMELTNSLGEAFRTDDTKKKFLPNAVEMQTRTINNQRYMQQIGNQQDKDMAGINHGYKDEEIDREGGWKLAEKRLEAELKGDLLTGALKEFKGSIGDNVDIPSTTEADYKKTVVEPARNTQENAFKELVGYIKDNFPNEAAPDGGWTPENIEKFVNAHNGKNPTDQEEGIRDKYTAFKNATNDLNYSLNRVDAIDKKVKAAHSDLLDISKYDAKPLTNYSLQVFSGEPGKWDKVDSPPPVTQQDMVRILNGENVKGFTLGQVRDVKNYGGGTGGMSMPAFGSKPGLYYNGKEVMQGDDKYLGDLFRGAQSAMGDKLGKLDDYKTKEYTPNYFTDNKFNLPNRNRLKEDSQVTNRIKTLLNATGNENEKNGFQVLLYDETGEGAYVVPLDKNGEVDISHKPADVKLANMKKGQSSLADKVKTPMGYAYYIPNLFPRPAGIGSDRDIKVFQSNRGRVQDLTTLVQDKLVSSAKTDGYVTSDKLDDGTLQLQTSSGKDATVVVVYGANEGVSYKVSVKGDKTSFTLRTPDEVSTLLSNR